MHVRALGLSCETPAATVRELQTCTFQALTLNKPPKFHEKNPERHKKSEMKVGEGQKREILGPPPFRASPFRAAPFRAPFFWVWGTVFILLVFFFFLKNFVCGCAKRLKH